MEKKIMYPGISSKEAEQLLELVKAEIQAVEPVVIFLQHQQTLSPKKRLSVPHFELGDMDDQSIQMNLQQLMLRLEELTQLDNTLSKIILSEI